MTKLVTFQVIGRTIQLHPDGSDVIPLADLADWGGIAFDHAAAAVVRLFAAPTGVVFLADVWEGADWSERLCAAHFRRNFAAVGIAGSDADRRIEEWRSAWTQWRERLERAREVVPGRKPLQVGHLEPFDGDYQWVRPRSDFADVPPLTVTPVAPRELDPANSDLTDRLRAGRFGVRQGISPESLSAPARLAVTLALAVSRR